MANSNNKSGPRKVGPISTGRWTSNPVFRWMGWGVLILLGGLLYASARPMAQTPANSVRVPGLVVATDDNDIREQEVIPNSDPFQKRPLFLPKLNVTEYFEPVHGVMPAHCWPDIGVDSRNISHITWMATVFAPGGGVFGKLPKDSHECSLADCSDGHAFGGKRLEALPIGSDWKVLIRNPAAKKTAVANLKVKQDPDDAQCQLWYVKFPDKDIEGNPIDTENGGHWHVYPPHPTAANNQPVQGFTRCQLRAGDGGGLLLFEFCFAFDSVYYDNDRYETRKANSFAKPYCLAGIDLGENTAFHPEMAVDSGNNIHVVFTTFHPVTGQIVLAYRRFDRNTNTWIATFFPEDMPDTPMQGDLAHLEVDSSDVAHIVFIRTLGQVRELRYTKATIANPSLGSHFAPSELIVSSATGWNLKMDKPRLALGTNNTPHVAFIAANGGVQTMWYTNRTGSPWIAPENVPAATPVRDCDLAVFGTDVIHFVWCDTNVIGVFYRKRDAGAYGNVKVISETQQVTATPRVVADSRDNVRCVYNMGLNDQAYVGKVKRPKDDEMGDPQKRDKWGRREPIEIRAPVDPDFSSMELALNQNDNLYSVHGNEVVPGFECSTPHVPIWFSHEFEPNLGEQDPYAMYEWGAPNTLANVANGNLVVTLPLFASEGVGFSTNFTLFYNSLKWNKSSLSPGWLHNYHLVLTEHDLPDPTVNIVMADGRRVVFTKKDFPDIYTQEEPYFAEFSWVRKDAVARDSQNAAFLLERKDGVQIAFLANGKLDRFIDTQALQTVQNAQSNVLRLIYGDDPDSPVTETGIQGDIPLQIFDSANRETRLDYDQLDRLTKVTYPYGTSEANEYVIEYDEGLKGKIKKVSYPLPRQGAPLSAWGFEYWPGSVPAAGEKHRINLLSRLYTPRGMSSRGTQDEFYTEFRFRQDNKALSSIEPKEISIVLDALGEQPEVVSDPEKRKRAFNYAWEPWTTRGLPEGLLIERPNTRRPNEAPVTIPVRYEPNEDPVVETDLVLDGTGVKKGNNVPKVHYKTIRDHLWKMEYQYLRSLVDNQTDPTLDATGTPDARFVRRWFNSEVTGAPVSKPTFRNLTVHVDKLGIAEKYTYYLTGSTPGCVKDNQFQVFIAADFNNKDADAPGPAFYPPREYTYSTDGLNRIRTIKDPRGFTTEYRYDGAGNLEAIVYPLSTDHDGLQHAAVDRFRYDTRGRLKFVVPAEFEELGRFELRNEDFVTGLYQEALRPEGTNTTFTTFNMFGNEKSIRTPTGAEITINLDKLQQAFKYEEPSTGPGRPTSEFELDEDGNITLITEQTENGVNKTKFVWDKLGRLTEVVQSLDSPQERHTFFVYDREGNERSRTSNNGTIIATENARDPVGRVIKAKLNLASSDPQGDVNLASVVERVLDANGNATKTIENGKTIERTFDSRNQIDTVKHPDGANERHVKNENGHPVKIQMYAGNTTLINEVEIDLDERGRQRKKKIRHGDGCPCIPEVKFRFDNDGRIVEVIYPQNSKRSFVYDKRGRMQEIRDNFNVTQWFRVYDEDDRITEIKHRDPQTDQLVTYQRFTYTDYGGVKEIFDAFGVRVEFNEFDINGQVIRRTDADGTKVRQIFDSSGRLTQIIRDEGGLNETTAYQYDLDGKITAVTDPNGNVYRMSYNAIGQLEFLELPGFIGVGERRKYNAFGELRQRIDSMGRITNYVYDDAGRLTLENHATLNVMITRSYNPDGFLQSITDGTSEIRYDYDCGHRVTNVSYYYQGAFFKNVSYTFDETKCDDLRKTMVGPEGEVYTYGYDGNNRLVSVDFKKSGNERRMLTIQYDPGGRLVGRTLGNGIQIRHNYNRNLQLTSVVAQDAQGQVVSSAEYVYRPDGNRSSVNYAHLGVSGSFTYNSVDYLTGEFWTGNISADDNFQNVFVSNIGNESIASSAVCTTPQPIPAVQPHYQFYTYDLNGNRTKLYGSNRASDLTYNSLNQLVTDVPASFTLATSSTATASDTATGYDVARINDGDTSDSTDPTKSWKSEDTGVEHFAELSWAEARTLSKVKVFLPTSRGEVRRFKIQVDVNGVWQDAPVLFSIGPTPAGNGWYKSSTHENLFDIGLVSTSKVRFLQDAGGGPTAEPNVAVVNELQVHQAISADSFAYNYALNGNLLSRSQGSTLLEEFGYDYANRINSFKRTTDGNLSVHYSYTATPNGNRLLSKDVLAGVGEAYMYDGVDVIADYGELSGVFSHRRSYVEALTPDSKVARVDANGDSFFYMSDALGSVTTLTSNSAGVVNYSLTNAWGEDLTASQAVADRYGFTQRERDSESGLMHFRARKYDARLGRFLQKDPLSSIDRGFAYASNNPVNLVDPMGLQEHGVQWKISGDHVRKAVQEATFIPEAAKPYINDFAVTPTEAMIQQGARIGDKMAHAIANIHPLAIAFRAMEAREKGMPLDFKTLDYVVLAGVITHAQERSEQWAQYFVEKGFNPIVAGQLAFRMAVLDVLLFDIPTSLRATIDYANGKITAEEYEEQLANTGAAGATFLAFAGPPHLSKGSEPAPRYHHRAPKKTIAFEAAAGEPEVIPDPANIIDYRPLLKGMEQGRDARGRFIKKRPGEAQPGGLFEDQLLRAIQEVESDVQTQVWVKTSSGRRLRLDVVSNRKGVIMIREGKSAGASTHNNQIYGFPEIEQGGATVVSRGKGPYKRGYKIPPTKVQVVTEAQFAEFLRELKGK